MKVIEKLNEEEFTNYCLDKLNELESETTYFGQVVTYFIYDSLD